MSYKIVFFDIDGTLVNEQKEIPESALQAVLELKRKGIETVIATGRAPYFITKIAEQLGIDSFVCLNGAYVVYKGRPVVEYTIPKEHLEPLVERAGKHNHYLVYQGKEAYFSNAKQHPALLQSVSSLKVELPGYDPDFWRHSDVYQAFLHCTVEEEHLYTSDIPHLRFVRWHRHAMDVMPVGGSKARGIQDLLQHLEVSPEEVVAFGDGLNDREMLTLAGLGIAMGNGHEQLKACADHTTTDVDNDGIANGLKYAGLL